jgi:hypothetical protein
VSLTCVLPPLKSLALLPIRPGVAGAVLSRDYLPVRQALHSQPPGSMPAPSSPSLNLSPWGLIIGSLCGVADMPLTGPIPEGRPFFCPHCGALYSVTDSPRPKGDNTTAKCVVCTQTMVEWASTKGRVYKLIHRPEDA